MGKGFDDAYRETADFFGREPSEILSDHYRHLDPSLPVLDLGAGQGRHALFLARAGLTVDAVEPSAVGVERMTLIASREQLPMRIHHAEFQQFTPRTRPFGGVLLLGLMPLLTREEIDLLLEKVDAWTTTGSLIFVTTFSSEDPACAERATSDRQIGRHSYVDRQGQVWTYLEPREILHLFAGYKVVHHWEGLGEEHRHGDGPLERHASIDAVFRKP